MTLTCPSEPELLLFALADSSAAPDPIARHVAECASCQVRVAEFRRLTSGIRASASGAAAGDGECLDELALTQFVEGIGDAAGASGPSSTSPRAGTAVGSSPSVVELLADPSIAGEVRQARAAPRSAGTSAEISRRSRSHRRRGGSGVIASPAPHR